MPRNYTIWNFGRNVAFSPRFRYEPRDEREVLEILARHRGQKIRVGGRLHSWSEIVRTDGVYIDLSHLSGVRIEHSGDGRRAVVGGGCTIERLLAELRRQADATLPTIGLITAQSIAGAISTGTHGSGRHSMSHYVEEVRLATYDAETGEPVIRTVTAADELRAARCSLGAMGVILSVTLRCRPAYRIEEHAARYETIEDVLAQEEAFPLQQFFLIPWLWRYYGQHRRETAAPRHRTARFYRWYWLWAIDIGLHLVVSALARVFRSAAATRFFFSRVFPLFVLRRWKVVDWAEDMLVMDHELFRHIEIEIFVTRQHLLDAAQFVRELLSHCGGEQDAISAATREQLGRLCLRNDLDALRGAYVHHYPICFRKILPDDTYISMAAGDEPYYSISFISYARPTDRAGFLQFADFLARSTARLYSARPHWGKVCPIDRRTAESLYPQLAEFRAACRRYDPSGAFCNAWVGDILAQLGD